MIRKTRESDNLSNHAEKNDSPPSDARFRHREASLLLLPALIALAGLPLLQVAYGGSPGFASGAKATGALIAVLTGTAFLADYHKLGKLLYLPVALAFFAGGTEDLTRAFLELAGAPFRNSASSSLLMPLLLLTAPLLSSRPLFVNSSFRKIAGTALIAVLVASTATWALHSHPLGTLLPLSDTLSALLFLGALIVFFREYRRTGDTTLWWLTLSIAIGMAGRIMLFFETPDILSAPAYSAALLGCMFRRMPPEDIPDWETFRMSAEVDRFNALYLENVVLENIREISESQMATIHAMSILAESRDDVTGKHIERTRDFCRTLAKQLREDSPYTSAIDDAFIDNIFHAASLHDIGKVAIPDAILLKPDKLAAEEFEIIKRHPGIGAATLENVRSMYPRNAFINMGAELTLFHHEKWDGSGYPEGLAGENIPLSARIMAIADVYDALRSERPYKEAFSHEAAYAVIQESAGTHFDPMIVEAFIAVEHEFDEICERMADSRTTKDSTVFSEEDRSSGSRNR